MRTSFGFILHTNPAFVSRLLHSPIGTSVDNPPIYCCCPSQVQFGSIRTLTVRFPCILAQRSTSIAGTAPPFFVLAARRRPRLTYSSLYLSYFLLFTCSFLLYVIWRYSVKLGRFGRCLYLHGSRYLFDLDGMDLRNSKEFVCDLTRLVSEVLEIESHMR